MNFGTTLANAKYLTLLAFVFILSACGSDKLTVVNKVDDAESIVVTNEGRVFVAGSQNVYEVIKKQDGSFIKLALFEKRQRCEIGGIGIIQNGDYLYAHCTKTATKSSTSESMLLAAKIVEPKPSEYDVGVDRMHPSMSAEEVSPLRNFLLPAGMATDGSGNLYIADTGRNTIYRITFATPTIVSSIEKWNQTPIHAISGLEWSGESLFYTAMKEGTLIATLGHIKRNPDGSAGQSSTLLERPYTVFDDIALYNDGIIVTDYLKGSLIFWKEGTISAETPRDSFHSPSAVMAGKPPLFNNTDLLVTEKGVLLDNNPMLGNRLSRISSSF